VARATQVAPVKARALLTVEAVDGRTVVRELRSQAPVRLMPQRNSTSHVVVHLVSSVTAPLGGDDLELVVRVGPGAGLVLRGVAATLALPGHGTAGSSSLLRVEVADGGSVEYLPEPTVVTARARHTAAFVASLGEGARLRAREVLVLGRVGERPGTLVSTFDVRRDGPVLRQSTRVGMPEVDSGVAGLAGRRVLGTELMCWGPHVVEAVSHDWASLVPLARGGSLATVLADDAVTVERVLDDLQSRHPGSGDLLTRSRSRFRGEVHTDGHSPRGPHHHPGGFAPGREAVRSLDR
jgi:urease accessory protein